jgi:flagellar hook assembly protein FlgD
VKDNLSFPEISQFQLQNNYPNPFNPSTQITYSVPKVTDVTLKIYDILGREIAILVNEKKQAGDYKVTWDAEEVPSGVYFYRIVAGEYIETKKMAVVK